MSVPPYDATPGFTARLQIRLGLSLHSPALVASDHRTGYAGIRCSMLPLTVIHTKTKANTPGCLPPLPP